MINLRRSTASLAALVILYARLASAALNDVFPADFVALPEGRSTETFIFMTASRMGLLPVYF
jgi:hypothetical protein